MISHPPARWFEQGLKWTPKHVRGFGLLSIFHPDPDDPLHRALGVGLTGGVENNREVLAVLGGVIAGEILREGALAARLKTAAESFEAAEILDLTRGADRVAVGVAERIVRTNPTYAQMMEQRRTSEARVVGLRHYANVVTKEQEMHRTDRADERARDMSERLDG